MSHKDDIKFTNRGRWPDRKLDQDRMEYLQEKYSDIEKNFYYPGSFTDVSPIFALEGAERFIYQDKGGDWGWNNNPVDESFIRIFDALKEEGEIEDFYVGNKDDGIVEFQLKVGYEEEGYSSREVKVYHGDVKGDVYSFTPEEVQNAGVVFSRGLSIPIRSVSQVDEGTLFDGQSTINQPFRYDLPPSIELRNFGLENLEENREVKVEHLDPEEIEEREGRAWERHEELELRRGREATEKLVGEYLPRFSDMVEEYSIEVEGDEIFVHDDEANSQVVSLVYEIAEEVHDKITEGFPEQYYPSKVDFIDGEEFELIVKELSKQYRGDKGLWKFWIPFL